MACNLSISDPLTVHTTGLLLTTSDGSAKNSVKVLRDVPIMIYWRISFSDAEIAVIAKVQFKDSPFIKGIIFEIKSCLKQYRACGYIQISQILNESEKEKAIYEAAKKFFAREEIFKYVRVLD